MNETVWAHLHNRGLTAGQLALSKAGHDRGRIYLVVAVEGSFADCVDGNHRLIDHPKRKRVKHLRSLGDVESFEPEWRKTLDQMHDPGQQNAYIRHLIIHHPGWQPDQP
jgi:hypothetical protein